MNATKVNKPTVHFECSCISIEIILLFLFQSMIGHSMGAAGGLEAIAIIKAIQTGWLHPTINQFVCDAYYIPFIFLLLVLNLFLTLFFGVT